MWQLFKVLNFILISTIKKTQITSILICPQLDHTFLNYRRML